MSAKNRLENKRIRRAEREENAARQLKKRELWNAPRQFSFDPLSFPKLPITEEVAEDDLEGMIWAPGVVEEND